MAQRRCAAATRETVKRLLAVLEGEEEDDRALGRIFGEELPSGLVLAAEAAAGSILGGGFRPRCIFRIRWLLAAIFCVSPPPLLPSPA